VAKRAQIETVADLTWRQALAWRLQRQHLSERLSGDALLQVTSALCGLHAQVMSSAELTVWARTEDFKRDAIKDALWDQRTLVKLWAMRGTLHLIRSDEFALYLGALRTYDHYLKSQWLKYFETSRDELEALLDAVHAALDGRALTREALATTVAKQTGSPSLGELLRASWGSFLKPSSFRGHLCFAPNDGRNVTFIRPDKWIGAFEELDPHESLKKLIRRFIRTYGPVTREDIARWWSGLSAAGVTRLLTELGGEVAAVDVEGRQSWVLSADVAALTAAAPSKIVNLLPAFDQYVVTAPRDAAAVLDPALKARVYRQAGWLSQVLLVDGRIVGVWTHERTGKRLEVAIEPFEKLPRWVKAGAEREAKRLQEFLGGSLSVTWSN
jgi:hypothetical protein